MPTFCPTHRQFARLMATLLLSVAVACQSAAPSSPASAGDDSAVQVGDQSGSAIDAESAATVADTASPDAAAAQEVADSVEIVDSSANDAVDSDAVDSSANDAVDSDAVDSSANDAVDSDAVDSDAGDSDAATADTGVVDTATQDAPKAVEEPEILQFSDVSAQAVPNNPLACRVTWKTNLPASSLVLFGPVAPTMRMRDEALVLSHNVLVLGMRANQSYTLQARSKTAKGTVLTASPLQFVTPALPSYLLPGTVKAQWSDPQEPHFLVLAGLHLNLPGGYNPYDFPPTAVMYDDEGQIVWYHSQVKGSNILAWMSQENNAVLVAGGGPTVVENMDGDVLWQGASTVPVGPETGPPQPETGMMHGDLRLLPNGNFLGIEFDVREGAWGDQLVERKPDGKQVWLWSTFDYFTPVVGDWTHGNSLQPLDNGTAVLYSPRNLSMVYRIDRATGKILMKLGQGGDFALQAGSGDDWFALQHSAEELPNNRILLYDNGTLERGYSRAVEYQYDLNTKKAKIIWQYTGEPGQPFFSPGQGSVQRLWNGDTLISAPDWKAGWAMPASLRRVGQVGGLKWRLELPVVYDYPTVAYRVQLATLPGLEFIPPGQVP